MRCISKVLAPVSKRAAALSDDTPRCMSWRGASQRTAGGADQLARLLRVTDAPWLRIARAAAIGADRVFPRGPGRVPGGVPVVARRVFERRRQRVVNAD